MMKRLFSIAAAFAAIFAFASCQDAIQPVSPDNPVSGQGFKVFTATTEMAATKTSLDGNDTDGYVVNWETGDQITIVDNAGNVGIYTTNESGTKADFTFTSGTEVTEAPFKAYYPASMYNNGTPTLPSVQEYSQTNIHQAPMYAESSSASLQFKNLGGIIRLNLTTNQSDIRVKSIRLVANEGMSGDFTITDEAAVISSTAVGVKLDCGSGVAIGSTPTPFHISLPAKEAGYTNLRIIVTTTQGGWQTRSANKAIVIERSKLTDISLAFNDLASNPTDLSSKATANTYIVSQAGTYKFKATVKGNGGLDPVTGTKATTISPSSINGATILWELAERGKAVNFNYGEYDLIYDSGYVFFRTPATFAAGDAYVAIFHDGDGGVPGVYDKDVDEILWSWLIWTTDAPAVTTYGGLNILDRNLGATGTGDVACRGMMYEWGRKDPFPSPNNGSYTPNTFVPDRMTAFSISNFDAEGMTVAYSIAHPTTYIQGWSQKYWQTESEFTTEMWWKGEKTIYDPCPAGWKVPSKDEMQIVINSGVNLPGNGFIGNVSSDFGYGNPSSQYYWTSTGYDRNRAWGYHGGFTYDHVDDATRSGWSIRPVEDLSSIDLSGYTDLSAAGTANSYIVAAAGDYKFKATVKGNGRADLAGISKTTAASDISKAELVWASYGTTTAPASGELIQRIGYKDGYVFFSTGNAGYREGNAVLAIKDASDNILWSWHLWFESDNLESLKQTYPGGAVFMDRDLGARAPAVAASISDDINAFGLLYQWGRKDPFLNTCNKYKYGNSNGTNGLPAVQGSIEQRLGALSLTNTVADAVQYPFRFYYSSSYNINGSGTTEWATDMVDGMWSDDKTIFDPCPAGWRVPDLSDWNDNFMTLFSSNSFDGDYNDYTRGIKGVSIEIEGGQAAYFPVSGLRYRYPLTWYNNGTTYYRCYGYGVVESPMDYHLHYWAQDGLLVRTRMNGVEKYNKNTKLTYSQLKGRDNEYGNINTFPETLSGGFSVRCVKE